MSKNKQEFVTSWANVVYDIVSFFCCVQ